MRKRRGFVKYAILYALKQEPMHGYKIMKELEERSGGLYTASPGTVYPALQELTEQDKINFKLDSDKKIYMLNESGDHYLQETMRERKIEDFWDHWRKQHIWRSSEEAQELKAALEEWEVKLRNTIKEMRENPQQSKKLITFIKKITKDLEKIDK